MTTDFRQLKRLAHSLGLTYQQLLARYHTDQGHDAPHSQAAAWAQQEVKRADDAQALQEVRAGFIDSRVRLWAPVAFSLATEVHTSLVARADIDREALPHISPGHYLDAALRTGPRQLPGQLACMRDFLEGRGSSPLRSSTRITFRLGTEAHTAVSSLQSALRAAGLSRQKGCVVSALTARFLDSLPRARTASEHEQPERPTDADQR
ncbi:hypothetical protein ABR737_00365 [Streptomyces sp. Edi2]|uniref:hypothetical protein n=1 Tax=Streptomyces sp. Edi2 TaxID=3162528 RepID=UPI0033066E13